MFRSCGSSVEGSDPPGLMSRLWATGLGSWFRSAGSEKHWSDQQWMTSWKGWWLFLIPSQCFFRGLKIRRCNKVRKSIHITDQPLARLSHHIHCKYNDCQSHTQIVIQGRLHQRCRRAEGYLCHYWSCRFHALLAMSWQLIKFIACRQSGEAINVEHHSKDTCHAKVFVGDGSGGDNKSWYHQFWTVWACFQGRATGKIGCAESVTQSL